MDLKQVIPGVGTSNAPSCTNAINSFWLAWKGEGTDTQIYYTRTTIREIGGTGPVPYLPQAKVPNALSNTAPVITHFNDTVSLAWKSESSADIYWCTWSESSKTWSTPVQIVLEGGLKPATPSAPALVGAGPLLYLCWRDLGSNNLWWSTWSEATKQWSPGLFIPIFQTGAAPALAANSDLVYLSWKSLADNTIWWSSHVGANAIWTPPFIVPTSGTTNGPSLAFAGNTLWLAWQGSAFQNLYYTSLINPGSNQWAAQTFRNGLGTGDTPALAATTSDSSGIMFAAKGENSDSGIYYGPLRLPPQKYIFLVPSFQILNMRSGSVFGKTESDTDYLALAVKVGNQATQIATQSLGDQTGGTVPTTAQVLVDVQDDQLVSMHYLILNSSKGSSAVDFLKSASTTLLNAVEKADEAAIKDYLGVDISSINSAEAGVLLGAQIGNYIIPGFGAILGAIAGWIAGIAPWGSLWPDCDGPVAAGLHVFNGATLRLMTTNAVNEYALQTDDNPGVDSQGGCGSNSHYKVTWSIIPIPTT